MLKVKQALEIIRETANFNVSSDTLYNWLKTGRLPSKKLGGIVLIDPSDLENFLADFLKTNRKFVGKAA